jgi:hypothetical protein
MNSSSASEARIACEFKTTHLDIVAKAMVERTSEWGEKASRTEAYFEIGWNWERFKNFAIFKIGFALPFFHS